MGIKGRGRSGTSRDSNPACQCCSSAHLVQCEPDEASSFTNPNVGPGYQIDWLDLASLTYSFVYWPLKNTEHNLFQNYVQLPISLKTETIFPIRNSV